MNAPVSLRAAVAAALPAVGRCVPLRALSSGRDGQTMLARVEESSQVVELRYATVALTDAARWRSWTTPSLTSDTTSDSFGASSLGC
jgi:hypothetical protein